MLKDKKLVGKLSSGNISGNVHKNSILGQVFNKILGLDFIWDGTRLGVKKEGTKEYSYADLQGPKGDTGPQGQPGITPVKGTDYFTANDISEIQKPITDQYDASYSYVVGDYCIKDNTLYKCLESTTGNWDSTKWSETKITKHLNIVEVGNIEPNGKVWIKTGKNHFKSEDVIRLTNCNYSNGVITQNEADTATNVVFVLQAFLNTNFITNLELKNVQVGKTIFTFVKDNSFNQIQFGASGRSIDTKILVDVKELEDGQTYTLSFDITNTTQGSICWKDIQIEQGTTASEFEPYVSNEILVKDDNNVFKSFFDTEKIKFKKGKNLFNNTFYQIRNGVFSNIRIESKKVMIKDKINIPQAITLSNDLDLNTYKWAVNIKTDRGTIDYDSDWINTNSWTVSQPEISEYVLRGNAEIYFVVAKIDDSNINVSEMDNYNFQIEVGTTATSYEPYINKEILVKNDNGVFERFADIDEIENSIYDTGWIPIQFTSNDWKAREGSAMYAPKFRKIGNIVFLQGQFATKQILNPGTYNIVTTNLPVPDKQHTICTCAYTGKLVNMWIVGKTISLRVFDNDFNDAIGVSIDSCYIAY